MPTPHNAEIYRSLTETYLSLNLLNEARNSAKGYIQHRVYDDSAVFWFASMASEIQSRSNERDPVISEAIHQLLKLIQKNPKNPRYWLELGKLQVIEKDVSAATAAFDQLVELDCLEDEDSLLKSLSLFQAGSLFLNIKEYKKSAFYLEQASKSILQRKSTSDPIDEDVPSVSPIQILTKASEAYRLAGQYETATDLLRQVIDLNPELPDSYSSLGEL